ncbi:hypothetical protein TSUD_249890 [Trifolium subterraneum]|nr:hypothetical protein TSUD_249890 [Trifolium subterraneum]
MAVHSTSKLNLILCLSSTLLLLSSVHVQAESQSLKYCEKSANYAVHISNVEILPDPVVRGEPFTFKIDAYTGHTSFPTYLSFVTVEDFWKEGEPILSGDLIYEISFAGIDEPAIFHHALSEETPLPVAPGHFLLTHTELLPAYTPPGTYNVKLTFKDQNDKRLTCVVFPFTIGAKSSICVLFSFDPTCERELVTCHATGYDITEM